MRFSLSILVFVQLCLLLGPPASNADSRDASGRPPNVVLLIGDDHGWPYSGFMGDARVHTPNLDALAASGTTFVDAHSPSSLCVPALRSLLAGVHSEQWDRRRQVLATVLGPLPTRSEVQYYRTVPRELTRRGYLTWEGGKLWEGTFASAGFTHGLATLILPDLFRSAGDQFGRAGWADGTALAPLEEFLDQARDRPFFLWVAPLLPHTPYDAPPELAQPYLNAGLGPEEAPYFANVSWLDALVGRLLATLDRRGMRDDTVVLYLSDNGKDATEPGAGVGLGKGTLHELGFRTPLIVRWPGHVPAGVVRDDLVSTLDVPATILDLAGAEPIRDLEGRSLRDAVLHGVPVGRTRLVGRFRGNVAANDGYWVRTAEWRYLAARDGRETLHAIAKDPFETHDVAAAHPDLVQRFRDDVRAWQARLDLGRATLDVTGELRDPDGLPLGGETLELGGRSSTGRRVRLRVLTGADGGFRFDGVPQGSYLLSSRRPGDALALAGRVEPVPVPLPAGSIDAFLPLRARPPAAPRAAGDAVIAGSVRTADGNPAPGVIVR
ncbi:sulfatase-like hydrolase/transferase, partial [Candidatus Binatia bacterium]|nr:sulfatase-like hydrolase/transferase [Candidatus Binatia bacterium]